MKLVRFQKKKGLSNQSSKLWLNVTFA